MSHEVRKERYLLLIKQGGWCPVEVNCDNCPMRTFCTTITKDTTSLEETAEEIYKEAVKRFLTYYGTKEDITEALI